MSLDDQNKVTVMLMQALWGSISPNFRMVALDLSKPVWQLQFILEKESEMDREEVEEVICEFESLLTSLDGPTRKFSVVVTVDASPLAVPDPSSWRVVFRRRETI